MFAIVATSGKQFKVSEGDRILVARVAAEVCQPLRLAWVLMVGGEEKPMVGTPFVSGAAVEATVVAHRSGDKIIVFKFEARKRKRRKTGHRQELSELRIGAIRAPGSKTGERPAANARPAPTERPVSAKPTPKARKPAVPPAPKTTQE